MLSRVADNLFWFSRYVRRAENTARLVGVGSQLQLDMPRSVRFTWRPMVDTVGAGRYFEECHPDAGHDASRRGRDPFPAAGRAQSVVAAHLGGFGAREILRSIRDSLPQDVWEAINDLYLYIDANGERGVSRRYRIEFLTRITDGCLKVSGPAECERQPRHRLPVPAPGHGLEQADMTTRIIDAGASGLVTPRNEDDREAFQNMQWMSGTAFAGRLPDVPSPRAPARHRRTRAALPAAEQRVPAQRAVLPGPGAERAADHAPASGRGSSSQPRGRDDPQCRSGACWRPRNPAVFMDEIQVHLGAFHAALADGYFRG